MRLNYWPYFIVSVARLVSASAKHCVLLGQVRQLSWCTVVVVVSHDPAFLAAFAEWSLRGRLLVWSTRLVVVTRLTLPQLRALLPTHWTFAMMNAVFLNMEGDSPHLNFYGAAVNVTALPYMPVWGVVESQAPVDSPVTRYEGSDYQMLAAVADGLNFTIRVLPSKSWAEVTYVQQNLHGEHTRGVGTVMLNMVGLILGQSFSYSPSSAFSSRILLAAWLVFVIIFSWSYSGNLTASLTLPKYPSRPETLSQLVQLPFCPARQAHLGGRRFLKYQVAVYGSSRLYVGRETLFPGPSGWPIPHDAPYKAQLDLNIMAIVEASLHFKDETHKCVLGLFVCLFSFIYFPFNPKTEQIFSASDPISPQSGLHDKWSTDMVWKTELKVRRRQSQSQAEQQEDVEAGEVKQGSPVLTLSHMQGAFILLILGLALATLAFVRETWHCYAKTCSRRYHTPCCGRRLEEMFPKM
ncbi:uncharacterized protein LOC126996356 [Eriocheir sinensis]|uniref:uncharacterized protein LOC126996356 n=1 Tax=Eriocheir sinensis TaxID=95602 RepID=UPI0021C599C4|nr:uncharacterized protein LOC126996356 [Eriocheir sinensis]